MNDLAALTNLDNNPMNVNLLRNNSVVLEVDGR